MLLLLPLLLLLLVAPHVLTDCDRCSLLETPTVRHILSSGNTILRFTVKQFNEFIMGLMMFSTTCAYKSFLSMVFMHSSFQ